MKNLIQIGDKPSEEAMEQAAAAYKEAIERYDGDVMASVQEKLKDKEKVRNIISKELSVDEKESKREEIKNRTQKEQEDELDR